MPYTQRWTESEKELVKEHYGKPGGPDLLARRLQRSRSAVMHMASELGAARAPIRIDVWKAEEEAKLKELAEAGLSRSAISKALGRSMQAVKNRLSKLGLSSRNPRPAHEIYPDLVAAVAAGRTLPEMARAWGISAAQISVILSMAPVSRPPPVTPQRCWCGVCGSSMTSGNLCLECRAKGYR